MTAGGGFGTSPDKKAFSKIITDDGIASATTAEDSVVLTGKNGTEVKAIGKTISIDAGQLNVIWHKFPWADTGDITIVGTTVTSTAGSFESDMVGAKIKVGDLDFIISAYSSATSVQVVSNPYGTVTGPNGSWGIYNKAIEVTTGGSLNLYGTSSNIPATMYSESAMILPNLVHTIGSLIGITADSFQLTSGVSIAWRSGNLATDSTRDVGITRNAEGVIEVFDGITAGEFRDMVVRNISGATATAPEHYVPLAQMEAADAAVLAAANSYADSIASDENYTTPEKTKVSYITITQAVNLDDIETRVNDLDAAVVLKGTWDQTTGVFPGSGIAQAGWSYLVNGATTTVDGIDFNDGDRIIAVTDNASTTTYAGNWYKADYTDKVNTVAGRTGNVVITSSDLSDFNSAVNALITTTTIGALIGSAGDATPNDTDVVATALTGGGLLKKITWTNVKVFLKTYFDTLYPQKDRLLENATVTGTYNLDYNAYELWNLTLTGTTTFTESNLHSKTILIRCTGNFALTFPANWSTNIRGSYVGTLNNLIVIQYFKSGLYEISITQPD